MERNEQKRRGKAQSNKLKTQNKDSYSSESLGKERTGMINKWDRKEKTEGVAELNCEFETETMSRDHFN